MFATVMTPEHATAALLSSFAAPTVHVAAPDVVRSVVLNAPPFLVPYSRLFLSPGNVRSKEKRTIESVRPLAAMIDADGLLADLQVSEECDAKGAPTGRYGVEAGGRRWLAIGLLITEKRLPEDAPVSCRLVSAERATGVSLAENISVERMHPADEFAAFAKLIAEGKPPEQVAKHFGVKVIDVQRRMKLAKVAPSLVAQYRLDQINLDQLMAFASIDDQKRQVAVWKALPEYQRSASSIRRRLTDDEVPASDPRVKLIGIERYKASGGAIRFDLFTEESFLEAGLVDLITAEVLAEAAERVQREGWAWVEVFETMGYEERQRFSEPPPKYFPESEAVRLQREAMEAKLDELADRYDELVEDDDSEDEDSEAGRQVAAVDAQCDELRAKLDALQRERIDTSGYDKAALGAIVLIDAGVLKIKRGMMNAKEAKAETQRQAAVRTGANPGAKVPSVAEFSEKLMADLTSHRTAAMQAALADNVPVALAVLADRLSAQTLTHRFEYGYGDAVLQISSKHCQGALDQNGTGMAESAAATRLQEQRNRWEALVPGDAAERLSWLLRQPQETVLALITFCTALSVDVIARRATPNVRADAIAAALTLDMADWWTVGVDNFLGQVSKAKITAIVTEARGAEAAAPLAAMKKAEACAKAAELLRDTRWLPVPMRPGTSTTPVAQKSDGSSPTDAEAEEG